MAETEQDMKWCSNCKRDIASTNFVMHDAHCRRNIVLCEECNEPISRTECDEHYQEYHAPVKCELCNEELQREKLEEHKKNQCPKRSTKCLYCELEMPAVDLNEHQEFCGSRTQCCSKCQQYVMYRDFERHQNSDCSFPAVKNQRKNSNFDFMSGAELENGSSGNAHRFGVSDFAIDELNRLTNNIIPPVTHGAFQQNNLRAFVSRGGAFAAPHVQTRNDIHPLDAKPGQGAVRKNMKKNTKNSDRERENRGLSDVDRLLALQLQDEDDVKIPCEFCGQQFSMEAFMVHQTVCRETDLSTLSMNEEEAYGTLPNNRATGLLPPIIPQPRPSIIDNVGHAVEFNELTNSDHDACLADASSEDGTFFPCEFCDKLFTKDDLIQHQYVCDVNNWHSGSTWQHALKNTNRSRGQKLTNEHDSQSYDMVKSTHHDRLPVEERSALPNYRAERPLPSDSHQPQHRVRDKHEDESAVDKLTNSDHDACLADASSEDGTFFPCEFCDKLFTKDDLIQHQAECNVNKWYDRRTQQRANKTNATRARGYHSRNKHCNMPSGVETETHHNNLPVEDRSAYGMTGNNKNTYSNESRNKHSNPAQNSHSQNKNPSDGVDDEYKQGSFNHRYDGHTDFVRRSRGSSTKRGRGVSRGHAGSQNQRFADRPPRSTAASQHQLTSKRRDADVENGSEYGQVTAELSNTREFTNGSRRGRSNNKFGSSSMGVTGSRGRKSDRHKQGPRQQADLNDPEETHIPRGRGQGRSRGHSKRY